MRINRIALTLALVISGICRTISAQNKEDAINEFYLQLDSRAGLYHINENILYNKWLENLIVVNKQLFKLKDPSGKPVLYATMEHCEFSPFLLEFLSANGFDLTVKDDNGNNIVHFMLEYYFGLPRQAAMLGTEHFPQIDFFGANQALVQLFYAKNASGYTPYEYAQLLGMYCSIVNSLSSSPYYGLDAMYTASVSAIASVCRNNESLRTVQGKFMEACYKGDRKTAEDCLKNGASNDTATVSGITGLHLAVAQGSADMARMLIGRGADINKAMANSITPLTIAYSMGKEDIVSLLLDKKADPNIASSLNGDSILHMACRKYDVKINQVDFLIKQGANVNKKNNEGKTPLELFVPFSADRLDLPFLLLSNGADAALPERDYFDPAVNSAASTGNMKFIKAMFDHGAVTTGDYTDFRGWGPDNFRSMDDYLGVLDVFLKHGANINSVSSDYFFLGTLLIDAYFTRKNTALADKLIQRGADIMAVDRWGLGCLHWAMIQDNIKLAKQLIDKKLDVNLPSAVEEIDTGSRALGKIQCTAEWSWPMGGKNLPMSKTISRGSTPLHIACMMYNDEMTGLLLSKGAKPGIKDLRGRKPLDLVKGEKLEAKKGATAEEKAIAKFLIEKRKKFLARWEKKLK